MIDGTGGWVPSTLLATALLRFAGICFTVVRLRTQNLLVAAVFHTFGNCPVLVFPGDQRANPATMVAILLVRIAFSPRWEWLHVGA